MEWVRRGIFPSKDLKINVSLSSRRPHARLQFFLLWIAAVCLGRKLKATSFTANDTDEWSHTFNTHLNLFTSAKMET